MSSIARGSTLAEVDLVGTRTVASTASESSLQRRGLGDVLPVFESWTPSRGIK